MPLVNVHMAAGLPADKKRAMMESITDSMVDSLGVRRESVRVWVSEFPMSDFMAGGETLEERFARLAAEQPPGD